MKINTTDNVFVLKDLSFYGSTIDDHYLFMTHNVSDVIYLYVDSNTPDSWNPTDILSKHFSPDEVVRFTTMTLRDEIEIIKSAGVTDEDYAGVLRDYNLYPNYNLFRIEIKQNLVKRTSVSKFKDESNMDESTFYVVLRNDLGLSTGMQATYVSEVTTAMLDDLRIDHKIDEFNDFLDLSKNTVILQASGEDLFKTNFIPAEYADPKINFTYVYEDTEKVAHHNFRLTEGKIVAMGFFGIKRYLPKFLRKLSLYGE